jgi:predicted P-loop ATPase/GTPase
MKLLVAGSARVDAGKTTFSAGLLAHTGAVGFKPRAGNDYWFDHDDCRDALEGGRLFGKDAARLAGTSPGRLDPEEINPVHRLWRPSPEGGSGLLGQEDREFLLDRAGSRYVVNDTVEIPGPVREHLPVPEAIRVASLDELNRAMEQYHLPALDAIAETVAATESAVVESYSDIARPLRGFEPDAVAVVEPRRARIYEGDRYVRACEVASRSPREGQLEERVGDVLDLVDSVATASLPPLTAGERSDAGTVADAYGEVYRRLVGIAENA